MISLVLLSVLVASIGSIDTVAAKHLRKENDFQPNTGIDGQGLEPHRVEVVPNSTATDAVPNEEAGSITATLSSSAVKKPITATLASSAFKKPPRQDSEITDEEWDIVEKGTDALAAIEVTMNGLPDGTDPAEIMNFLGEISNIIGTFVPQFAFVGAAFGILGTILGKTPELAEDPMLKFLEDRFNRIDKRLDELLFEVKRIKMEFCKNTWDSDIDTYIVDYRTHLNRLKNPKSTVKEKQMALTRLKSKCVDTPPIELLGRWKNDFIGEGFSQCFQQIKEDSDSRVLYFRKTYTALFLRYMMQAVELDGLCLGIMPQSSTNKQDEDETTKYFKLVRSQFKLAEDNMFKSTPSEWRNTLNTRHRDCKGNADCTYKALKDNFFPGYAYATFKVATDRQSYGGPLKQDYGMFEVSNGVNVIFRNPNNSADFYRLKDLWKNEVCKGTAMCYREEKDCWGGWCSTQCEFSHCNSLWHMVYESTKRNNLQTYNMYVNRNALMLRTEYEVYECERYIDGTDCCAWDEFGCVGGYHCGGRCASTGWVPKQAAISIGVVGDSQIADRFTTSWETEDGKRTKYAIIGVGGSGNF